MKLRPPPFEIPDGDPYRFDRLQRKEAVETVANIIRSSGSPLTISLHAPWGFGKSTFVQLLGHELKNEPTVRTISVNAWENDFVDDAMVALLGDLELGIEALHVSGTQKTKLQKSLAQAMAIGKRLVKNAAPTAIKIATAGIVDLDQLTEEALAELSERLATDKLNQYESARRSVLGFRQQLEKVAAIASDVDEQEQTPLVIIIDELDRCRPPHAIRMLEIVKHFFSVPNIVFVMAMDREQLGHSIRSSYGADMDVDGYLARFMDVQLNLPQPSTRAFCDAQFDRFGLNEFFRKRQSESFRYDREEALEAIASLSGGLGLSLRAIEKAFVALSLAVRATPERQFLHPLFLMTLVSIRLANPALYDQFVKGDASDSELLSYLRKSREGRLFLDGNYGFHVEAMIAAAHSRPRSTEFLKKYRQIAERTSETAAVKERAARIVELGEHHSFRDDIGRLRSVTSKIDLFAPDEN